MVSIPKNSPALKVELWALSRIRRYPKNPMIHPPEQIAALAADMIGDGVSTAILVDERGEIIAGDGRFLAAEHAGFTHYPVMQAIGWSEAKKRAVRIKDNARARQSRWNDELLHGEVVDLRTAGYDIKLLGLPAPKLIKFDKPEPIAPAVPPTKPVSKRGDIWHLGDHRLLCGDATLDESWTTLIGAKRASLVFTDPPYGVSYQSPSGEFGVIEGDRKRRDALYRMLVDSLRAMAKRSLPTAAFYIWHASETREDFAQAMKACGLVERQYLMWVKPSLTLGHADYQWQHEPFFYAAKDGQSPAFYADRSQTTVWYANLAKATEIAVSIASGLLILDGNGQTLFIQSRAPKGKKTRQLRLSAGQTAMLMTGETAQSTVWEVGRDSGYNHPTQKPMELARRAIENSTRPGEIVIDGFMGSGTTLLGAEATGRIAYGTELDPRYCDVIVERWQAMTERPATLGETGATWAQTKSTRGRVRPVPASAPAAASRLRAGTANHSPGVK